MVKSTHVGFRLHPIHDKDILDDVEKYKNATARWKEVYRFMLAHQAAIPRAVPAPAVVEHVQVVEAPKTAQPIAQWTVPKDKPEEPLDWSKNFPKAPTVVDPSPRKHVADKAQVRNAIRSDF